MNITKREFEVISLYARGLTFKEIGKCLSVAERTAINYFMKVKDKSKSRVTRAKKSRSINKRNYQLQLKEVLQNVKAHNLEMKKYNLSSKEIPLQEQERFMRLQYLHESLIFAYKSYHRFRLKSTKKVRQFLE